MRLWTLHPRYLDARGLVALWREGLLAQAVLEGRTSGYQHHPQIERFRESRRPVAAIAQYLRSVQEEAELRGYAFDHGKISTQPNSELLRVTSGQLRYEWEHLRRKLLLRAPGWLAGLSVRRLPEVHPLFCLVPGRIEKWERPVRPQTR